MRVALQVRCRLESRGGRRRLVVVRVRRRRLVRLLVIHGRVGLRRVREAAAALALERRRGRAHETRLLLRRGRAKVLLVELVLLLLILLLLMLLLLLPAKVVFASALELLRLDVRLNVVQGRVLPPSYGFKCGELESGPKRSRELKNERKLAWSVVRKMAPLMISARRARVDRSQSRTNGLADVDVDASTHGERVPRASSRLLARAGCCQPRPRPPGGCSAPSPSGGEAPRVVTCSQSALRLPCDPATRPITRPATW